MTTFYYSQRIKNNRVAVKNLMTGEELVEGIDFSANDTTMSIPGPKENTLVKVTYPAKKKISDVKKLKHPNRFKGRK